MKFTDEQEYVFALAMHCLSKGLPLRIDAFSGTGKSTTLAGIANLFTRKRGRYISFNRAIAEAMKPKLPSSCLASTFHKLAHEAQGRQFGSRLNTRISGRMVAMELGFKAGVLSPFEMGSLVLGTVKSFCQTLDPEIGKQHVPVYLFKEHRKNSEMINDAIIQGRLLWERMSDPYGKFPTTADVYLRLYAQSNPEIDADYILFDEAQDADSLMISILERQKVPVIFVGDRWQQIYAWRGAVNAMTRIKTENSAMLSQSFRFGPAIADRATDVLAYMGEKERLKGFEQKNTQIKQIMTFPFAVVSRTNAQAAACIFEYEHARVATTGLSEAQEFFRAYIAIRDHQSVPLAYRFFRSVDELREYSESFEGRELKPYFTLIDSGRRPEEIQARLAAVKPYDSREKVDLVVSTAHKSKGLEFPRVVLTSDFLPAGREEDGKYVPPTEEEVRLLYVAMTRASEVLDDSRVPYGRIFLKYAIPEAEYVATASLVPTLTKQEVQTMKSSIWDGIEEIWGQMPFDRSSKFIDAYIACASGIRPDPTKMSLRWQVSEASATDIINAADVLCTKCLEKDH